MLPALLMGAAHTTAAPQQQIARQVLTAEAAPRAGDELETLGRAARILAQRGYRDEAGRVLEIMREMRGEAPAGDPRFPDWAGPVDDLEARATELMRGRQIEDRETRIELIRLSAEAFAAVDRATEAEAMRWFSNVGTEEGAAAPIPELLQDGEGNVMLRITETIELGSRLQAKAGRRRTARALTWLARFYRERDGLGPVEGSDSNARRPEPAGPSAPARPGRPGTPGPAGPSGPRRPARPDQVVPSDPAAPSQPGAPGAGKPRDLTYIEGRAPVLGLAAEAYRLESDLAPEARERGAAWMTWMASHADLRVRSNRGEAAAGPVVPAPGEANMGELIALIEQAGKVLDANGRVDDARRCFDLANYYAKREAGEAPDNSRTNRIVAVPVDALDVAEEETQEETPAGDALEARRAELEAQIAATQARIEEVRAELERLRRERR